MTGAEGIAALQGGEDVNVRHNRVGNITVYAGTAADLAAVADEYAAGVRQAPHGYEPGLFQRAAQMLRTGHFPAVDLGAVRFYRDRADGTPFHAPLAPEADPAWGRRQRSLGVILRG